MRSPCGVRTSCEDDSYALLFTWKQLAAAIRHGKGGFAGPLDLGPAAVPEPGTGLLLGSRLPAHVSFVVNKQGGASSDAATIVANNAVNRSGEITAGLEVHVNRRRPVTFVVRFQDVLLNHALGVEERPVQGDGMRSP